MDGPLLPEVGAVLSADIAVPEHEREVRFHSRVLSTGADPLWRPDLVNNLGLPITGLGERTGEMAELPVRCMPHIQVSDVVGSVRQALELDGNLLMEMKDEAGESQWAVLRLLQERSAASWIRWEKPFRPARTAISRRRAR